MTSKSSSWPLARRPARSALTHVPTSSLTASSTSETWLGSLRNCRLVLSATRKRSSLIMTRVQMFTSIIWIAVLFVVPACFAGTISLSLPPGAISAGDTFTVGVAASGYTDLYAFQFDLAYNPSILSSVSVSEGSFLLTGGTTFFIAGAIYNATGVVSGTADTLLGAITGVNGGGILATVPVSYTHLRAHETRHDLVCRLLLEKK